jgi:hypothetical protein
MVQPIVIEDNFLSAEDLLLCSEYVSKYPGNFILSNSDLTDYIWKKYKDRLRSINPTWNGLYPDVTISNSSKPVSLHRDQSRNAAKHKILIYLNEVKNGGTFFYINEEEHLVENKPNRLIIFDISLYHKGQNFQDNRKISIGFRILDEPMDPK